MPSVLNRSRMFVLRPEGHLNATTISDFQYQLTTVLTSQRQFDVAVDFSLVESLDSQALMVLVSSLTLAQQLRRRFSLCSLSAPVKIVLELTQLDRAFEIFPDEQAFEAAIA